MTIDRRGFLRASTSALALQPSLSQLLAAREHSSRTSRAAGCRSARGNERSPSTPPPTKPITASRRPTS